MRENREKKDQLKCKRNTVCARLCTAGTPAEKNVLIQLIFSSDCR